jgi:hypothetical protein
MTFLVFSVLPAPDSPLLLLSVLSYGDCRSSLRHEDTLVLAFVYQIPERLVGHREDVRFRLFPTPSPVHVDVLARVYGQRAVGIYRDQKETRVSLSVLVPVPCLRSDLVDVTYIRSAWYRMCRL